jgi:hypothetical protein
MAAGRAAGADHHAPTGRLDLHLLFQVLLLDDPLHRPHQLLDGEHLDPFFRLGLAGAQGALGRLRGLLELGRVEVRRGAEHDEEGQDQRDHVGVGDQPEGAVLVLFGRFAHDHRHAATLPG